jgi:hypothetical protein
MSETSAPLKSHVKTLEASKKAYADQVLTYSLETPSPVDVELRGGRNVVFRIVVCNTGLDGNDTDSFLAIQEQCQRIQNRIQEGISLAKVLKDEGFEVEESTGVQGRDLDLDLLASKQVEHDQLEKEIHTIVVKMQLGPVQK